MKDKYIDLAITATVLTLMAGLFVMLFLNCQGGIHP